MFKNFKAGLAALCLLTLMFIWFINSNSVHLNKYKALKKSDSENITSALCEKIFEGNLSSVPTSYKLNDNTDDDEVEEIANLGCSVIVKHYGFNVDTNNLAVEEIDYPIAFSVLAHQSAQQLLILLSQIYFPHNVYCIHIDVKASAAMYRVFKKVEKCFLNIHLATKREDVVYSSFSRLQADLNCMEDLLKSANPWNHLINLSGMDFPIKTNLEIVRALKTLNGRNKIAGDEHPNVYNIPRTKFVHKTVNQTEGNEKSEVVLLRTDQLKSPPPYNITIRKNLAYNVYARSFLHWVIFDSEKAKALLDWSRDTGTPDEHYWLMLDALEEAPARTGKINWGMLTPFVIWKSSPQKCNGYWRHYNCVFGYRDIPTLIKSHLLFANKFDVATDSLAVTCIQRWLNMKKNGQNVAITKSN